MPRPNRRICPNFECGDYVGLKFDGIRQVWKNLVVEPDSFLPPAGVRLGVGVHMFTHTTPI